MDGIGSYYLKALSAFNLLLPNDHTKVMTRFCTDVSGLP